MHALDKEFLESLPKELWFWWTYIDDFSMIWHHGENKIKQLIDKRNKFHPSFIVFILQKNSAF